MLWLIVAIAVVVWLGFSTDPLATRLRGVLKRKKQELRHSVGSMKDEATEHIEAAERDNRNFKQEIADAKAALKDLNRRAGVNIKEAEKWTRIASNIVNTEGEVDREAFDKADANVQKFERLAEELTAQAEKIAAEIEVLTKQYYEHQDKIEDAKTNVEVLEAREVGTKLRKKMHDSSARFGGSDVLGNLDAYGDYLQAEEDKLEALDELSGSKDDDLERRFLHKNESSDDRMSRYKV